MESVQKIVPLTSEQVRKSFIAVIDARFNKNPFVDF